MHTDAMAVQLEKGMSETLRSATKRDDGQVAPATDERHDELLRPGSRCCSVYRSLR